MSETSEEYKERLVRDKLRCQHRKFSEEIFSKLKYCYRLYDSEPYPKKFSFVTSEICDAVRAISYLFRCHYRQVYYYLHNDFVDPVEYEMYCFSLPVQRGKKYTFNFLFRISFIFEITMYLFKEGYDYFNIARKSIAEYPDLLYFDASGGWNRLNEISSFVLYLTKPKEVEIAVQHPLLGTFIETIKSLQPPKTNRRCRESIEIQISDLHKECFNPKEMQSLKLLHKHFVASRTPKCKYKTVDLLKIHETFPISNRVRFQIEKEADEHYYIIYDLYIEKREIIFYFRSYLDPEVLEKYFPLKTTDSVTEEMEEALRKFNAEQESLSQESDDVRKKDKSRDNIPECFDSVNSNDLVSCENNTKSENVHDESDHCIQLLGEENSKTSQSIYSNNNTLNNENCHDTGNKDVDKCTQLPDENIPFLNIPDMPRDKKLDLIRLVMDVSRFNKKHRDFFVKSLPTIACLKCFDQSLINSICLSVPHAPEMATSGLQGVLQNISHISPATKYILFKIIGNSNFPTKEKKELFHILINLPDNILAEKASIVRVINRMDGCSDKVKSDLIHFVSELTDDECCELRQNCYNNMKTASSFKGVFKNVEEVTEEFEKFELLCKTESELDFAKLQEFKVPLIPTELSRKQGVRSQIEMWLGYSNISMPKACQENKSLKNVETQDEKKIPETDIAASGTSLSATPKSLEFSFCQKSEVPNPSRSRQRWRASKKSKKRSKK